MASLQVAMFSRISAGVSGDGCSSSIPCRWKVPTSLSVGRAARRRSFRVSCEVRDDDSQSSKSGGEEPPESLFMKELKRRGMTPSSLLEDTKRGKDGYADGLEEDRGSRRNAVSTEVDSSLSNQRERSLVLNSEGLEGLIPRAKLLLSLGGTFFLGFGPLIVIIVGFFCAMYLYFGSSFVHDGSEEQPSIPQYVDPYELLEDESISQMASRVD
ncbi:hypothetical protein MLD38_013745 [Melastoma candidum]|uniref:Uncharacterized protein n=1 Tax=Melastoma candidum TaxID=119954 RepID=A0ACB9REQ6_9MYRT|nr:hypothetical protein MLD38_013745 [Melastoma candidum]